MEKIGNNKWNILYSLMLIVLWCALPGICLFLNNAYEMPFRDVLLPIICSVALGILCFFICLVIFRDQDFSALLTVAGMGLFLNFNFVIDLVNMMHPVERLRPYYVTAAVVFAVLFCLLWILKKRTRALPACNRLALCATISILAVSLIFSAPTLIEKLRTPRYHQTRASSESGKTMPNIYYILSDEYASFTQIKNCYGYDNSEFYNFLTEAGFCVSDSSYNLSGDSMLNITAIVNLEPAFTDVAQRKEQWELLNNARLYGILENLGYDLYQTGNLYPLTALIPYVQSNALAENGAAAMEILITNSMLRPFSRILYWESVFASREKSFQFFNSSSNYAKSNRATFFYVCSPHVPYYCDANGNRTDMDTWMDRSVLRYYLGQFIYITGKLETMISSILENDPDAVILLQSDHGQRQHGGNEDDTRRILNALYMGRGAAPVDITGLSGYNTWRALLNALGEDYPLLPEEQVLPRS